VAEIGQHGDSGSITIAPVHPSHPISQRIWPKPDTGRKKILELPYRSLQARRQKYL
jgi:hypothetical protein